jgi:hypothetical protein
MREAADTRAPSRIELGLRCLLQGEQLFARLVLQVTKLKQGLGIIAASIFCLERVGIIAFPY